ncbi:MAG: hypothetical protein AAFV30_03975, partial [Pseudomonadota bacterium]
AEAGLSADAISAIMGEYDISDALTAADKAVIAYADRVALTNPEGRLTPELTDQLREHFSSADICELGTVMAVIAGMAKLSFVLDLVEKEAYCEFATG